MRRGVLLLALLAAGSCRTTRVEVETVVDPSGGAVRSVTIRSEDEGAPAEHPADLLPVPPGYAVIVQEKGLTRTQGVFPDAGRMPPPFGFQEKGSDRPAAGTTSFQRTDWGLFTLYRYSEQVGSGVDTDAVKAALDEASRTTAELLAQTFAGLFGEVFDDTLLRKRMRTAVPEALREAGFVLWQELSWETGEEQVERSLRRVAALARRLGVKARDEDWLRLLEEDDLLDPSNAPLRQALADWVREGLAPVQESPGRVTVVPDLEAVLFHGAFEEAWTRAVAARFGGAEGFEEWAQKLWLQAFGVFGPDRRDVVFRLRVRMPGQLLQSNGYLEREGWSFVEFPAGEAYPSGKGLQCLSVLWEPAVIGLLPAAAFVQDNRTALAWTWLAGEGPGGPPSGPLVEVIHACARARSLGPLEEFRAEHANEPELLRRAARVQDWLEGERE